MVSLNLPKSHPLILKVLSTLLPDDTITIVPAHKLSLTTSDGAVISNLNCLLHSLAIQARTSTSVGPLFPEESSMWVDFIYKKDPSQLLQIEEIISKLVTTLSLHQFLIGDSLSFADICVITYLEKCRKFKAVEKPPAVMAWINRCLSHHLFKDIAFNNVIVEAKNCSLEEGGKFVSLPNASEGNVVVRFPPEASGYLHIGHAKAALLNQFYRDKYKGKLILRFDDTNALKEKKDFEQIILEDVYKLGLTPDAHSQTSDHFAALLTFAAILIQNGDAYCDDSSKDAMHEQRAKRLPSPRRDSSVNDNLIVWEDMKRGGSVSWCLRAKIDYASNNGCMRDPTLYRACSELHPTTGSAYKVYPTYDFACPIVDSIEGVTHALRTSEYKDRDPQYKWVLERLGLRAPTIWEFSRLNMQFTMLSKRKLSKLVELGVVDGWDDPRMPTVRGLMRRGLTQSALREYVIAQGFSRVDANVSPDKLWAFNKRMVEPFAPVLTAVCSTNLVKVIVRGKIPSPSNVPLLPKSPNSALKTVVYDSTIYVEFVDAQLCVNNIVVTLINWGNAKVHRDGDIIELELDSKNKDYSTTPKISWLPASSQLSLLLTPMTVLSYTNLLTKPSLSPDDNAEDFVDPNSVSSYQALGESQFATIKKGEIVQIMRKGLFICDVECSQNKILTLIEIPSGRTSSSNTPNSNSQIATLTKTTKKLTVTASTKGVSNGSGASGSHKKTKLGLSVKKSEDFAQWYTQTLTKSEMLDYYNVSGCYVIRPHAYSVWERLQAYLDAEIKLLGVENCYFPLFVSESALAREKEHVAGFAAEVAWVTRAGESVLPEPIAIRPTSETVIYPLVARWVQSHRDLPLKLNQWCNVVRWEFHHPTPFLRTREFLWQEGHTIHTTRDDAVAEVYQVLDIYARVYEELLAVPVIKGTKSEAEKFAGAEFTTSLEGYIPYAGRGLQCATSHHLGQNFSRIFDIGFENPNGLGRQFAFQNSWGLSTRALGAMVMVHSDDRGLVLPPRVAPTQVVVIPCGLPAQATQETKDSLSSYCNKVFESLLSSKVRVRLDSREHVTSGWRFNHWELKGVPIRVEVGPKDLQNSAVVLVRRDNLTKISVSFDAIAHSVINMLDEMQKSLFDQASNEMKANICVCDNWEGFTQQLEQKKLIYVPFCGEPECEHSIRAESATEHQEPDGKGGFKVVVNMGAKSLCIPLNQPKDLDGAKCVRQKCNNKAKFYALFGRSF